MLKCITSLQGRTLNNRYGATCQLRTDLLRLFPLAPIRSQLLLDIKVHWKAPWHDKVSSCPLAAKVYWSCPRMVTCIHLPGSEEIMYVITVFRGHGRTNDQ
jgi:hypothetical protein